jgi:ABC-type phosphate/phosphonate transport system substrate-binding protein
MRCSASRLALTVALLTLLCALGCQTAGLRFLSLIGLKNPPLSVVLVADQPTAAAATAFDPFPAYAALQRAMSDQLLRPVAVDVCFSFQVNGSLRSGWHDVAVVSPAQYALLTDPRDLRVLAGTVDEQGRTARRAVLVVPVESVVRAPADLRGQVVAFGPAGDSRTVYAGLLMLRNAGLQKTDLALEVLPVPGGLKHFPDMRSLAQAVINGSAAAGFIDEAAWDDFPEHADQAEEPARDKLRILGPTVALPGRLLIASPKLDVATAEQVQTFLLTVGRDHPDLVKPLAISGYAAPSEELLAACRSLLPVVAPEPADKAESTSQPSAVKR